LRFFSLLKIGPKEWNNHEFSEFKIMPEPLRRNCGLVAAVAEDLAKRRCHLNPFCFSRGMMRQRGKREIFLTQMARDSSSGEMCGSKARDYSI
jgi:hypothetical protein